MRAADVPAENVIAHGLFPGRAAVAYSVVMYAPPLS
jgi:hypothetical protein